MDIPQRLEAVLGAMASLGPRNLRRYLAQPFPDFERATDDEVEKIIDLALSDDANHPARLRFSGVLRTWDNVKAAPWIADTARNSAARRALIHHLLASGPELTLRIDKVLPFFPLEEPVIIADKHQEWYAPSPGVRDYYWTAYTKYLREKRTWDDDSILNMDNSTRSIVECLADPESKHGYASRGLVMGYVQSGKTANFTGVTARAADAGYRLIIILAGTWNILRNQTQRRLDKELLGKELLKNDEVYSQQHPADWDEFLEHGGDPTELGHFAFQRLTRPDIDFKRLKAAIDSLEFEKREKALPIYDPANLHSLHVKLLVVKKHSGILANLVKDLRLIRTNLTDLPTLIIDDESDQAGINTVDPRRALSKGASSKEVERSKTNLRIVELLRLFPRGQYVGYTATPYANALANPNDPEDLFPRDFIISLDRPRGYMGVSDFFDPLTAYEDLSPTDFSLPEIAHIRRVARPLGEDDDDLTKALRSYVLSGALKLYRLAEASERYRLEFFKHHTMLIHTSQLTGEQSSLADRIVELWNRCAFNSPKGLNELRALWEEDYAKVSAANGNEVVPENFDELIPHLAEAIKRIEKGPRVLLVVNSDSSEAPDFSAAPVWKIIVGGNKLSRGYTVEGLTISYYRRVAGTADTLMQMGRWFGFRPGYRDLVRVFLGVAEGRRGNEDLVALFKDVCNLEEKFREDIKRYVRTPGSERITPRDVPALIWAEGSLPPTAANKMRYAVLDTKNFSGQWQTPTLAPKEEHAMKKNLDALETLLKGADRIGQGIARLGGTLSKTAGGAESQISADSVIFTVKGTDLLSFITNYHWLETYYHYPDRPDNVRLQLSFLERPDQRAVSWLVIAPQRQKSFGPPLEIEGVGELSVKHRSRLEDRGFQVFGESAHRTIAEFLAKVAESESLAPNEVTASLQNAERGIVLLYPVREQETGRISIGFELLFPINDLRIELNFTVVKKSKNAATPAPAGD